MLYLAHFEPSYLNTTLFYSGFGAMVPKAQLLRKVWLRIVIKQKMQLSFKPKKQPGVMAVSLITPYDKEMKITGPGFNKSYWGMWFL